MSEGLDASKRTRQLAWLVWIAVAISMSGLSVSGDKHSVTGEYRSASLNWIAGRPLYSMTGHGFIYLPQTALVFAPWGLLPEPVGAVAWRCTIVAILAAGVARFTRLVNGDDRWFLINTIVSAATAVGCVRNGQATLIIAGLMMLACVDLGERRWTRAAMLLVLAIAFKPTALILILLVGALFLPMLWRLAIGLPLFAIAPFLAQNSRYAYSQYMAFFENSREAFHLGETGYWAQLFGIFKVAGVDVPLPVQEVARIVFGLATLVVCWLAVRKLPTGRGIFYLYAISTCYLMLFNSRTEGSTYAMVAPVYGILLASAWLKEQNRTATTWLIVGIVATVLNYELIHLFTRQKNTEVWVCPFVCVLVTIYVVVQLFRELKSAS